MELYSVYKFYLPSSSIKTTSVPPLIIDLSHKSISLVFSLKRMQNKCNCIKILRYSEPKDIYYV